MKIINILAAFITAILVIALCVCVSFVIVSGLIWCVCLGFGFIYSIELCIGIYAGLILLYIIARQIGNGLKTK